MNTKIVKRLSFLNYLIPLLFAFILSSLFCLIAGRDPIEQYVVIFKAAFGSKMGLMNTLGYAAPIVMTGIATAFSFSAGVFNCGIEGQLMVGSLVAACAGYMVKMPHIPHVMFCLLAGALGGMLYALVPALLKAKLQINEVVTTIMLNNIAVHVTNFVVNGPLNANYAFTSTQYIETTAELTRLNSRYKVTSSLWIALVILVIMWFVIKKTRFGYEIKFLGKQREFSDATGMHVSNKILTVFLIGGVIAGICGGTEIMGVHKSFLPAWDGGTMGWDGFYACILANANPIGVLIVSILFGAFRYGSIALQSELATPVELIEIIKSMIILFFSIKYITPKTDFTKIGRLFKSKKTAKKSESVAE